MRPSLLILIITITVLAFVAHAIVLVFFANVPYALAFALDVLLLAVAGLSDVALISTVRRVRGLPLDPDAVMLHVPPPGIPDRRDGNAGRRVTDVGPSDIVRVAHAIKLSAGLRGAPISEAIARQQGLLDPLDLVQDDEIPGKV